jgi:hypothetical protein
MEEDEEKQNKTMEKDEEKQNIMPTAPNVL